MGKSRGNRRVILIASSTSAVGILLLVLGLSLILYIRKGRNYHKTREGIKNVNNKLNKNDKKKLFFTTRDILCFRGIYHEPTEGFRVALVQLIRDTESYR